MVTNYVDGEGVSLHDSFQQWRSDNQDGIFLNVKSRNRADLHGARCQHLGSGPPYFSSDDGLGSLTSNEKVCGPERELLSWASQKDIEVRRCQHCLRDGLIGKDDVPK